MSSSIIIVLLSYENLGIVSIPLKKNKSVGCKTYIDIFGDSWGGRDSFLFLFLDFCFLFANLDP